jgi:hypothetical protein
MFSTRSVNRFGAAHEAARAGLRAQRRPTIVHEEGSFLYGMATGARGHHPFPMTLGSAPAHARGPQCIA